MKKILQHRCFPVKSAEFLRTPVLRNICKRPLLYVWLLDFGCFGEGVKVRFKLICSNQLKFYTQLLADTLEKIIKVWLTDEYFLSSSKTNISKLLFINVSLNFTPRHEKDVVIAIYISFIKLILYIKRGQTKALKVWSNLSKFVVNFVYIWEYHTSKPHQKRSKKTQAYRKLHHFR